MTKKTLLLLLLALVALMVAMASAVATATQDHATSKLKPKNDSGIHGKVHLMQLSSGGTSILVQARGLKPGKRYISLYYDNHRCHLEPYSKEDVIGRYTANPGGNAATSGKADDDLDEIHSVSVRSAKTFKLLACARVDQ